VPAYHAGIDAGDAPSRRGTEPVSDPATGSTPRHVRVVVTLRPEASADDCIVAVVAVGGRIVARDPRTITADVPGGSMGRLALVQGVAAITAGESWDAPGRQPPDGPPEVRQRLEMRGRKAAAPDEPEED
jgi:hypothetical protein